MTLSCLCARLSKHLERCQLRTFLGGIDLCQLFHHDADLSVCMRLFRNPQQRQLRAFMGGIDLCHGRYDSPRHSLFRTLDTVHSDDFYQFCCPPPDPKQGTVWVSKASG